MKKLLFSISFLCYFAVTSGVIISSHFCMKKLVSVHLYQKTTKECGRCGMDTHGSGGCCHSEIKVVKLTQDQVKIPVQIFKLPALDLQVSIPSSFIAAAFENNNEQRHFHNHSPPLLSEQDTYLQNNVFRI